MSGQPDTPVSRITSSDDSMRIVTVADVVPDLKHKYWYMNIPNFGVTTTPLQIYTPHDLAFAKALSIVITGGSLYP